MLSLKKWKDTNDKPKKNTGQPELTDEDLVAEILEVGGYQKENDSSFEDAVMIGAHAIGEDLLIFLSRSPILNFNEYFSL